MYFSATCCSVILCVSPKQNCKCEEAFILVLSCAHLLPNVYSGENGLLCGCAHVGMFSVKIHFLLV